MAGVTIAPTTTMFAVAPVPLEAVGERERPRLRGGLCRGVGRVRMGRRLRLPGRDERRSGRAHSPSRRGERLRGVLNRADEQRAQEVPVLERRVLDRSASAPAADEVDETVDVPVLLAERGGPAACRFWVEQVDDVGLDSAPDLVRERLESSPVATRRRRARRPRRRAGERPSGRDCRRRRRRRSRGLSSDTVTPPR